MKNIAFIVVSLLLMALLLYNAFEAEKKSESKDNRIRELEFEVWSLKLDKHLDSISDHYVDAFKKKMDSLAGVNFSTPHKTSSHNPQSIPPYQSR